MRPRHHQRDLGLRLNAAPEHADRYADFAALAAAELEGVAWRIRLLDRASPVVILAPHGGSIEPTTSLLAEAIAGDDYSFYCFEGLQPHRPHRHLHVTAAHFDEPQALALVTTARIAVAVHGYREAGAADPVLLGGLDTALIGRIAAELTADGFAAATTGHRFPATSPDNICNRTARQAGAQLELSQTLRDQLRDAPEACQSFAAAVRRATAAHLLAIG